MGLSYILVVMGSEDFILNNWLTFNVHKPLVGWDVSIVGDTPEMDLMYYYYTGAGDALSQPELFYNVLHYSKFL